MGSSGIRFPSCMGRGVTGYRSLYPRQLWHSPAAEPGYMSAPDRKSHVSPFLNHLQPLLPLHGSSPPYPCYSTSPPHSQAPLISDALTARPRLIPLHSSNSVIQPARSGLQSPLLLCNYSHALTIMSPCSSPPAPPDSAAATPPLPLLDILEVSPCPFLLLAPCVISLTADTGLPLRRRSPPPLL